MQDVRHLLKSADAEREATERVTGFDLKAKTRVKRLQLRECVVAHAPATVRDALQHVIVKYLQDYTRSQSRQTATKMYHKSIIAG